MAAAAQLSPLAGAVEQIVTQPVPLFDAEYYLATYPDVGSGCDAWEHFLTTGAAEEKNPHPLFDTAHYLRQNPDVRADGLNPLLHYMTYGGVELRNAHPLFCERFYVEQHPEVRAAGVNPLVHFLAQGARAGYNPNHLFDVNFYLKRNPDVAEAGVNPLLHYLQAGASEGRDPHPLFRTRAYLESYPDVAQSGVNPLRHYLEHGELEGRAVCKPLFFSDRIKDLGGSECCDASPQAQRKVEVTQPIPVFCVYGASNVGFLRDIVIPAFVRQKTPVPLEIHFLNYRSREPLMEALSLVSGSVTSIKDWSGTRKRGHLGFGESMNYLFEIVNPQQCFVFCNPDSFPMADCLARLIDRYIREGAAIVEASQWPSSHPKEFDPLTHETPWASGAFGLMSAEPFRELGGFDQKYFLYLEDVDLSWRTWLRGYRVLHEPLAHCGHATGLHTYRTGRFYYEHFFSVRNFLLIAYKFFGEHGEAVALEYLKAALLPKKLHAQVLNSYGSLRDSIQVQSAVGENADKVKILGLNVFHELRQ